MTKQEAESVLSAYKYSLRLRRQLSWIPLPPMKFKDLPVRVQKALKKLESK